MRTALLGLFLTACTPLTFSHRAAVDFERIRVVAVAPIVGVEWGATYLVGELERESGFARLTTDLDDDIDAILYVTLSYEESVSEDENGDSETTYEATATFVLEAASGMALHRGEVSDDHGSLREALEDALDEVAAHYIPSYRI